MSLGQYDDVAIRALSPRAVAGWLRMRGFEHSGDYGEFGAMFARAEAGGGREFIVPTSPQARDFVRRMEEVVNDIAEAEGRSPHDILTDLTLAPFDVIKARSPDADDYGSVSLAVGLDLHEEARNVVLAAANAAASPQPRRTWRGRRPEEVGSYLNNLRLGQSQRGSFVLTILSPWDFTPESSPSLDLGEPTFGRRVTKKLAIALKATETAIRLSVADGVAPFLQAYKDGVSSNLCSALARLARESNGVDVSVDWSPVRPESAPVKLQLRRDDASILTEAANELAREWNESDVRLDGRVAEIAEPPEKFEGSVILEAVIDGNIRKVRVEFDEEQRKVIYRAATEKLWVRVFGDLKRDRNRLSLLNPRDISITEAIDIDAAAA